MNSLCVHNQHRALRVCRARYHQKLESWDFCSILYSVPAATGFACVCMLRENESKLRLYNTHRIASERRHAPRERFIDRQNVECMRARECERRNTVSDRVCGSNNSKRERERASASDRRRPVWCIGCETTTKIKTHCLEILIKIRFDHMFGIFWCRLNAHVFE